MRDVPAGMEATLAADKLRLIVLIEAHWAQATAYYALNHVAVSFGGRTYSAAAGAYSEIQESARREAPTFRLVLQNLDGVIGALVDPHTGGEDQRGRRVVVRQVTEADIADATAVIEDTFVIDAYSCDRSTATFKMGSPRATDLKIPFRRIQAASCPWPYKGAECGSVSTLATCDKSRGDCRARFPTGAALRWGGHLVGSSTRRIFVV